MPNAYVFPGGKVDVADGDRVILDRLNGCHGSHGLPAMQGIREKTQAARHWVAAVRETFEEAGILLASRSGQPLDLTLPAEVQRFERLRSSLNAGETTFAEVLQEADLELDIESLVYFAHWVTPEVETRRFDARFFMAQAPEKQPGRHDGRETTASCWLSAPDALDAYAAGTLTLAPPTWCILRDIAARSSLQGVLQWARALPVVPVIQPHFLTINTQRVLALPGDECHPEASVPGRLNRLVFQEGRWQGA